MHPYPPLPLSYTLLSASIPTSPRYDLIEGLLTASTLHSVSCVVDSSTQNAKSSFEAVDSSSHIPSSLSGTFHQMLQLR
jgi:hypothetical protein